MVSHLYKKDSVNGTSSTNTHQNQKAISKKRGPPGLADTIFVKKNHMPGIPLLVLKKVGAKGFNSPKGGWSIPPFFSQLPMGWISAESTRRQKSFLLSLPSRRNRRRAPVSPTTVAIQVDVVFLGSWASNFMPILNSLLGGV